MAVVLSNLPKPGEDVRYVDVIVGTGGVKRLAVDAEFSGTISVGAVIIKDNNTGLEADVITSQQGHNGLVVVAEEPPRSKVTIYGEAVVAPGGTLNLATYLVPTLKKFIFKGVVVGGAESGEFDVQISSGTISKVRNSGSARTIVAKFPEEPEASAGAVIDIDVTNIGDLTKSFEATIFGALIDA